MVLQRCSGSVILSRGAPGAPRRSGTRSDGSDFACAFSFACLVRSALDRARVFSS